MSGMLLTELVWAAYTLSSHRAYSQVLESMQHGPNAHLPACILCPPPVYQLMPTGLFQTQSLPPTVPTSSSQVFLVSFRGFGVGTLSGDFGWVPPGSGEDPAHHFLLWDPSQGILTPNGMTALTWQHLAAVEFYSASPPFTGVGDHGLCLWLLATHSVGGFPQGPQLVSFPLCPL